MDGMDTMDGARTRDHEGEISVEDYKFQISGSKKRLWLVRSLAVSIRPWPRLLVF
jgi:hypothetical protein